MKTVLVVGGAGYIGSHVNKMLHQSGYNTIVLDNLSKGDRRAVLYGKFIEGDIADNALLNRIFMEHTIDAVMHFAALTDVGESVINPLKYFINNVGGTLNLLEVMRQYGVNVFVFSSTAAIFGLPKTPFITEDHVCSPINPYGESKLMVEKILRDANGAYGFRSCCLRYFNAAGGDPEGQIKYFKQNESNLIPKVLKSVLNGDCSATIYGTDYATPDGTCVRDYVHIDDLGRAHIEAMKKLFSGAPSSVYNLGNGQGFSVREVIQVAGQVTGRQIKVIEGPRRLGDPPILVADSQKAYKELAWKPHYPTLETMILHAWNAMKTVDSSQ